ncbi:MAG: TetR/AcrR family transcriptional regulator [Ancrocorticia sp.]
MNSKERMIEAMSDLMWEQGFAATTPREVRERSGVGQGSMYHHFPTKRDLGMAAIESITSDLMDRSVALLEAAGDPLDRLNNYLSAPREPLKGCKAGRLTQDPVVARDPEMLAPVARVFDRITEAATNTVQEAIDRHQLKPDLDAASWARLIVTTLQGGYVLAIAAQDRAPYDEAFAALRRLVQLSTTSEEHSK